MLVTQHIDRTSNAFVNSELVTQTMERLFYTQKHKISAIGNKIGPKTEPCVTPDIEIEDQF